MNIVRALLRGLVTASIIAGCGSDGGSSKGSQNSETSGLAQCPTGYTGGTSCLTCLQKNCSEGIEQCYGTDYTGGECEGYAKCANKADDPCHSDCPRGTQCQACLDENVVVCARDNCESECKDALPPPKPTCADLAKCCAMITVASAKTGCDTTVENGNETLCTSYYASLSALCE